VNRAKLEKHLRDKGCHFSHHGGKHDIWIILPLARMHPFLGTPRLRNGRHEEFVRFWRSPSCRFMSWLSSG